MSMNEKLNCIIRMIIVVSVVMMIIGYTVIGFVLMILLLGIMFGLRFYLDNKDNMIKENYSSKMSENETPSFGQGLPHYISDAARTPGCGTVKENYLNNPSKTMPYYITNTTGKCSYATTPSQIGLRRLTKENIPIFDTYKEIDVNHFCSRNQALAGPPNPRTNIPPVIIPKSHDLTFWRANNLVDHSHINSERNARYIFRWIGKFSHTCLIMWYLYLG